MEMQIVRVTEPKIQKHEVQEGARREGTAVTQEASAQCSKEGVVRMAGQLSKIRNQTSTRQAGELMSAE